MEANNSRQQLAPLPRVAAFFSGSEKIAGIIKSLAYLSLCFPSKEIEEAAQMAFVEALEPLSPERLVKAFSRAARECLFFPSPADLFRLAGEETEESRSEREASEALEWVLARIRRHGVEGRTCRGALIREAGRIDGGGWRAAEYEQIAPPPTPEPIRRALETLGAGDVDAGAALIAEHPLLSKDPDEYPTLGLRLSAMEKLEARWLEAWRKAER